MSGVPWTLRALQALDGIDKVEYKYINMFLIDKEPMSVRIDEPMPKQVEQLYADIILECLEERSFIGGYEGSGEVWFSEERMF